MSDDDVTAAELDEALAAGEIDKKTHRSLMRRVDGRTQGMPARRTTIRLVVVVVAVMAGIAAIVALTMPSAETDLRDAAKEECRVTVLRYHKPLSDPDFHDEYVGGSDGRYTVTGVVESLDLTGGTVSADFECLVFGDRPSLMRSTLVSLR